MRNLQEQVKEALCYQKLFWTSAVVTNCSSDREQTFEGREFSKFLRSLEQFIQTEKGQKNFGNRMLL